MWLRWQGESLLTESTTKYYKQWSVKSEFTEVCYHGACACLKGAWVARWRGIPGVTGRSEDPLGSNNGWHQCAAFFTGIGAMKPSESRKSWCRLSALLCHKLLILHSHVTTFLGLSSKEQKHGETFPQRSSMGFGHGIPLNLEF